MVPYFLVPKVFDNWINNIFSCLQDSFQSKRFFLEYKSEVIPALQKKNSLDIHHSMKIYRYLGYPNILLNHVMICKFYREYIPDLLLFIKVCKLYTYCTTYNISSCVIYSREGFNMLIVTLKLIAFSIWGFGLILMAQLMIFFLDLNAFLREFDLSFNLGPLLLLHAFVFFIIGLNFYALGEILEKFDSKIPELSKPDMIASKKQVKLKRTSIVGLIRKNALKILGVLLLLSIASLGVFNIIKPVLLLGDDLQAYQLIEVARPKFRYPNEIEIIEGQFKQVENVKYLYINVSAKKFDNKVLKECYRIFEKDNKIELRFVGEKFCDLKNGIDVEKINSRLD